METAIAGAAARKIEASADRLIDLEKYTKQRWGVADGPIQWADLGEAPGACD